MPVLEGIRVLDLGHHIAGPLTARLLADHGAEVIRIDRPGAVDTEADAYLQAGKRRITLDLKDPADVETARRIAATCDVVIENFRPGVLDRLGLGADALRAEHPQLIVCSLPGFAAADPRAGLPGWEGVIAAATGNCRGRVGEVPADWDLERPTYTALPLASNFAAILASTAIVAALVRRDAGGSGARIEVPLFDAVFELMGGAAAYSERRGFRIEDPLIANGSGTYECADGEYVQFNPIGATMRFLTWFLDAAGRQDWIAEGLSRASTYRDDPTAAARLRERLAELFRTRPAQEWEDLGMRAGVPLCRIRTTAEWARTPHAVDSGQVVDRADPELGTVRTAGSPVRVAGADAGVPDARRPLDADREAILAELDRPAPRTQGRAAAGRPLEGLRVVDLTQILAGPSAGRALAEYGADVVKINAPQRAIEAHGLVNRGKRSILVDLTRTEGQELLWRLLEDADALTQNFPQGTAERYGFGYEHVHARRPDLVYVSVSCYGYGGAWTRGRGYEVQGQAVTGIMERTGRGYRPGVLGPYNVLDYGTGAMAGFASMLALYHQRRTGEGLHVSTSLAQTGTFHQATLLIDHPGKVWDEPAGRFALGPSALQRFYRGADRWFFLGAAAAQLDAVLEVAGVDAHDDLRADGALASALEAAFATRDASTWIDELVARGVGAHVVERLPDLLERDYVRDTGLRVRQTSDEVGPVVMPGPAVLFDGERLPAGHAASVPGADGPEVLAELGLDAAEIARLAERWVVQSTTLPAGWPV